MWKDGLCEGINTNHPFTQIIYPSLHTNHPFTQTIPSHKPSFHTNKIICNTIPSHKPFIILFIMYYLVCVKGWIQVTQSMPLHKPSLHTNHPFTLTIPSHRPSLHTNYSSFSLLHIIWFVWTDGLCEWMVHTNHLSLHTNHPFTQTIYPCEGMVCVKPSLHTNHSSFSVLHII